MKQVTCHNTVCPNNGIPIPYDQAAALAAVQAAAALSTTPVILGSPTCGGCGQTITDIAAFVEGAYEAAMAARQGA